MSFDTSIIKEIIVLSRSIDLLLFDKEDDMWKLKSQNEIQRILDLCKEKSHDQMCHNIKILNDNLKFNKANIELQKQHNLLFTISQITSLVRDYYSKKPYILEEFSNSNK